MYTCAESKRVRRKSGNQQLAAFSKEGIFMAWPFSIPGIDFARLLFTVYKKMHRGTYNICEKRINWKFIVEKAPCGGGGFMERLLLTTDSNE